MQKAAKISSRAQVIMQKTFWLLSTGRNILVVLVSGVICWLLESHLGSSPVKLTGHVKQGLPEFQLPPFQTYHKNETYNFVDMVSALGSGCLVIPLLSLLETISIAKVFSKSHTILISHFSLNKTFLCYSKRKFSKNRRFNQTKSYLNTVEIKSFLFYEFCYITSLSRLSLYVCKIFEF